MAGSVWEWVEMINYGRKLSLYDIIIGAKTPFREPVLRGGIWKYDTGRLRGLTKMLRRNPKGRYPYVGFRCAKGIDETLVAEPYPR